MLRMFAIALVCLPLCSGVAFAKDGHLRGAKTVDIIVEGLSEGARSCGLDENSIRAAVEFPISFTSLKVISGLSADFSLYIYVVTVEATSGSTETKLGCISTIRTVALKFRVVDLPFNDTQVVSEAILFRTGEWYMSDHTIHAKGVIDLIEGHTKSFVTNFNNDNK